MASEHDETPVNKANTKCRNQHLIIEASFYNEMELQSKIEDFAY